METEQLEDKALANKLVSLTETLEKKIHEFLGRENPETPGVAVMDDLIVVEATLTSLLAKTVAIMQVQTEADVNDVSQNVMKIFHHSLLENIPLIKDQIARGKRPKMASH